MNERKVLHIHLTIYPLFALAILATLVLLIPLTIFSGNRNRQYEDENEKLYTIIEKLIADRNKPDTCLQVNKAVNSIKRVDPCK